MSADHAVLDESIATCRFAQRVATIKNEARVTPEGVLCPSLSKAVAPLHDMLHNGRLRVCVDA